MSILRFDQRFLGKITGERNGKQAFTALNFRTKKTYGAFNFTPSARFNYGITNLSNFTDFISKAKPGTDIIYKEETFENGEIAGGFLFDINEIKVTNGISRPNGGFEMILDISPDLSFNHSNVGGAKTNKATIEKYSHKRLKGNNVLCLPGTDHASIAVQTILERQHKDCLLYTSDAADE